jgi:homoserine dehydrogenase
LRVHPTLVPARRLIANVEGVMNAVLVNGDAVGPTLYYGRGAGAEATASAVVADLVDVTRHGHRRPRATRAAPRVPARSSLEGADPLHGRRRDRLLPAPARARSSGRARGRHPHLCRLSISIDAIFQKEAGEGEEQVDVVILTHTTLEKNINAAIGRIQALDTIPAPVVRIRLEELL